MDFWTFKNYQFKNSLIVKAHLLIKSICKAHNPQLIICSIIYSVIFSSLVALAGTILFYAFGLKISFLYVLFVSTIIQILGMAPISLNSIGISEGLGMFLYSFVGIAPEISLAAGLVGRVSSIITSSLGGIFYLFEK